MGEPEPETRFRLSPDLLLWTALAAALAHLLEVSNSGIGSHPSYRSSSDRQLCFKEKRGRILREECQRSLNRKTRLRPSPNPLLSGSNSSISSPILPQQS